MPVTFEPRHTPIWQIHYYRQSHGDVGYAAAPSFVMPEEGLLKAELEDRFLHPKGRMKPPTVADVLDDDGKLVLRARILPGGVATVVPLP